jgi:hypothetical protein
MAAISLSAKQDQVSEELVQEKAPEAFLSTPVTKGWLA